MTPAAFTYLQHMLKTKSGLSLTEEKMYLLESRLMPIAKSKGLADLPSLVVQLQSGMDRALEKEVIDAMTTNESMFFRDNKPFDQFRQVVLPSLLESNAATKQIRIWSAACSNGQEPYSLAMCLKEEDAKLQGWRIEIVATDLCSKVLAKAREGIYSQFEVQRGLPIQMLMKYFQQHESSWQIKPELRNMVNFQEKNLLESYAAMGEFDVILCRNVLIYFDDATKATVLRNLAKQMKPSGFLYLGSTESVFGVNEITIVEGQRALYKRS